MNVVAVIGDVVESRQLARRAAWQKRLAATLAAVSRQNRGLASPFTITLGDEFQAVYRGADHVIRDLLTILEGVHPVRIRFALGVGPLSTAINPKQALGMDGAAFHAAREAMETMKRDGALWRFAAAPAGSFQLINPVMAYLGHQMEGWEARRLAILLGRLEGVAAATMADQLGISKVAVHKNIRAAALDEVAAICQEVTAALAERLAHA